MLKITIFLLVLVASTLAKPKPRIIGGTQAEEGEFPWQISLQDKILFVSSHYCGGSILNENTILTAGHCVTQGPGIGTIQIYAGVTKLSDHSNGQIIKVVKQIVHPDFTGEVAPNDIAILKLEKSLQENKLVSPIKLPAAGDKPEGTVTLSGWGVINNIPLSPPPDHLYKVDLPIITNEDCLKALGADSPVVDSNICTGPINGKLSACSGDSGGPLVLQGTNQQVGIVSWGVVPCGSGAPSVFTRVSSFLDFIEQNS